MKKKYMYNFEYFKNFATIYDHRVDLIEAHN